LRRGARGAELLETARGVELTETARGVELTETARDTAIRITGPILAPDSIFVVYG
jgi:hypothetical protein